MVKLLLQFINKKLAIGREIDDFANLYGKVTVIEYATKEEAMGREMDKLAHLYGSVTVTEY